MAASLVGACSQGIMPWMMSYSGGTTHFGGPRVPFPGCELLLVKFGHELPHGDLWSSWSMKGMKGVLHFMVMELLLPPAGALAGTCYGTWGCCCVKTCPGWSPEAEEEQREQRPSKTLSVFPTKPNPTEYVSELS